MILLTPIPFQVKLFHSQNLFSSRPEAINNLKIYQEPKKFKRSKKNGFKQQKGKI